MIIPLVQPHSFDSIEIWQKSEGCPGRLQGRTGLPELVLLRQQTTFFSTGDEWQSRVGFEEFRAIADYFEGVMLERKKKLAAQAQAVQVQKPQIKSKL